MLKARMNLSLNLWFFRFEENFFRVSSTIPGDRGIKGHGCSFCCQTWVIGVFTLCVEVFWIELCLGKHRETASVVYAEILLKCSC